MMDEQTTESETAEIETKPDALALIEPDDGAPPTEDTPPGEERSKDKEPTKAAPNKYEHLRGRVVRYHLKNNVRTVELVRVTRAKGPNRTGLQKEHVVHKHWNAVLVDVKDDGLATLKVLPHRSQARAKVKADGTFHAEPHGSHIRLLEGVKHGTEGGEWSPTD